MTPILILIILVLITWVVMLKWDNNDLKYRVEYLEHVEKLQATVIRKQREEHNG